MWYIYIAESLCGKKGGKREYRRTKQELAPRISFWKAKAEAGERVALRAGPELVNAAVNFHELFRDVYGSKEVFPKLANT